MRIFSRNRLTEFWEEHPESRKQLEAWFAEATEANWHHPNEIQGHYRSASILKGGRVVFNVGGNTYRLVAWVNYEMGMIRVRFVGTHEEYGRIDMENT
jgi:mRNA interferase HigB